jgi:hypothetical protein
VVLFSNAIITLLPSGQRSFSPLITDLSWGIFISDGTPLPLAITTKLMSWELADEWQLMLRTKIIQASRKNQAIDIRLKTLLLPEM